MRADLTSISTFVRMFPAKSNWIATNGHPGSGQINRARPRPRSPLATRPRTAVLVHAQITNARPRMNFLLQPISLMATRPRMAILVGPYITNGYTTTNAYPGGSGRGHTCARPRMAILLVQAQITSCATTTAAQIKKGYTTTRMAILVQALHDNE